MAATLETELASAFGVESAASTVSGSAALLAAVHVLTEPGDEVLVPGWISHTVVNAIVVAHRVPVLLDVTPSFTSDVAHADAVRGDHTRLLCYAPFGGLAVDLDAWLRWAATHGVAVLLDLVPCADVRIWARASEAAAAITSFGRTKLLGPGGGGAVLGDGATIARARCFLAGGRTPTGRKEGVGLELQLGDEAARAAARQLAAVVRAQDELRAATAATAAAIGDDAVPGWERPDLALTKVLSLGAAGEELNPDATYRSAGWRAELDRRHLCPRPLPPLEQLDRLYDRVRFHRIARPAVP